MCDSKQPNTLDRIRHARNVSSYTFAAVTAVTIVGVVLRDGGYLTPGVYGFIIALWIITALAAVGLWCTVYVCEWDARYARRAEQIGEKVDQISEVMQVAGYVTAMEDEWYNPQRANRN